MLTLFPVLQVLFWKTESIGSPYIQRIGSNNVIDYLNYKISSLSAGESTEIVLLLL
jgi:hypothetical protein